MKTVLLSLITAIIFSPSFSQNQALGDELKQNVVGTWQHVSSTDQKGNILRYDRKIELFADGTGICTRVRDGQSVEIPFFWDVSANEIMLYILNKRGKMINTDSQLVWDVDDRSLSLACTWESDDFGITSLYKKLTEEKAKF